MPNDDLTGKVTINLDFRPAVPDDSLVLLSKLGITSLEIVDSYRISSATDKAEVFSLVQIAATRIRQLEDGYKPEKSKADRAHGKICDNEKEDKAGWLAIRKAGLREMERWDREQARIAKEADDKRQREEQERIRKAAEDAAEIQRQADAEAERLRKLGEMRQAREVVAEATQQAAAVVEEAESLAELGTIAPAPAKLAGLGETRPWTASEVQKEGDEDFAIMETIRAIAASKIPLRYPMPVRGAGSEMVRLVNFDMSVAKQQAKRLCRENIGIPGLIGERDFGYRVSTKGVSAPVAKTQEDEW